MTDEDEEYILVQECPYEPPHSHEYPADWVFAGPDGNDPRGDIRWRSSTYTYLNDKMRSVWTTQTPLCDDQAIDEFTRWGPDGAVYLQVKRPDGTVTVLDWQYDLDTDTVTPLGA